MRASLLLLAVLATSLWACDPYAARSSSNESERAYFLRYTTPPEPDYNPFPSVVLLPARTSAARAFATRTSAAPISIAPIFSLRICAAPT